MLMRIPILNLKFKQTSLIKFYLLKLISNILVKYEI